MASFDANIDLEVIVRSKQLDALEEKLQKLNKFTLSGAGNKEFFNTQNAIAYNKQVDGIIAKLERIAKFDQQYNRRIGPQPGNANQYSGPIGPGAASPVAAKINREINKQKQISKELNLQAQQYAELDRLQRQLLANDNSRIRANEKLSRTQQFIQDKVSQGRMRRASAAIRGNENQYPTTIGPVPDFTARNRAVEEAVKKTQRIALAEERLAKTRADAAGRQTQFIKLQKAENKAKLEAARVTAIATGKQKQYKRELVEVNKDIDQALKRMRKGKSARSKGKNSSGGGFGLGAAIGFPLLFGGGPGSLIGGVLGQLKGGPDGAILGSGLGSAVDRATEGLTLLAQELDNTGDIFAALESGGYKVSGSLKNVVDELEDVGKVSEAYAIQLRELEKAYGKRATTDIGDLTRANQRLADSFKRLNAVLFAPLIPLATAISNISSGVITQLSRLFEFIAGDPASRAATPSFRLEGEFAQATGVEREIFNRSGRSRESIQQQQADQRKLIESFNSASQAQARVNEQQRKGAEELNKLELTRKGLAVERARIEADSLRYQLQIQGQIRNLETARRAATLEGVISFRNLEAQLGQLELSNLERSGGSQEQIFEAFSKTFQNNTNEIEKFEAELQSVYSLINDENIRGKLFPDGQKTIDEMVAKFRDLKDTIGGLDFGDFKTVPQQLADTAQDQIDVLLAQIKIEEAVTEELKNQAKLELAILQLQQANPKLKNISPELFSRLEEATKRLFDLQNQEVNSLASQINTTLASAMENALVDTITAAIQGTEDLSEKLQALASDLLGTLGRIFINAGISGLAGPGGLFGADGLPGFQKRADGGPVTANRPYIIGERGPELFVPNSSGNVVPNEALARYNGGNEMAAMGSTSVNVNYNVTDINGMRFVTEDQFQVGMATAAKQGAKAGESRVMASLRNRRSSRSSIGL